jgi:hypothetical protein
MANTHAQQIHIEPFHLSLDSDLKGQISMEDLEKIHKSAEMMALGMFSRSTAAPTTTRARIAQRIYTGRVVELISARLKLPNPPADKESESCAPANHPNTAKSNPETTPLTEKEQYAAALIQEEEIKVETSQRLVKLYGGTVCCPPRKIKNVSMTTFFEHSTKFRTRGFYVPTPHSGEFYAALYDNSGDIKSAGRSALNAAYFNLVLFGYIKPAGADFADDDSLAVIGYGPTSVHFVTWHERATVARDTNNQFSYDLFVNTKKTIMGPGIGKFRSKGAKYAFPRLRYANANTTTDEMMLYVCNEIADRLSVWSKQQEVTPLTDVLAVPFYCFKFTRKYERRLHIDQCAETLSGMSLPPAVTNNGGFEPARDPCYMTQNGPMLKWADDNLTSCEELVDTVIETLENKTVFFRLIRYYILLRRIAEGRAVRALTLIEYKMSEAKMSTAQAAAALNLQETDADKVYTLAWFTRNFDKAPCLIAKTPRDPHHAYNITFKRKSFSIQRIIFDILELVYQRELYAAAVPNASAAQRVAPSTPDELANGISDSMAQDGSAVELLKVTLNKDNRAYIALCCLDKPARKLSHSACINPMHAFHGILKTSLAKENPGLRVPESLEKLLPLDYAFHKKFYTTCPAGLLFDKYTRFETELCTLSSLEGAKLPKVQLTNLGVVFTSLAPPTQSAAVVPPRPANGSTPGQRTPRYNMVDRDVYMKGRPRLEAAQVPNAKPCHTKRLLNNKNNMLETVYGGLERVDPSHENELTQFQTQSGMTVADASDFMRVIYDGHVVLNTLGCFGHRFWLPEEDSRKKSLSRKNALRVQEKSLHPAIAYCLIFATTKPELRGPLFPGHNIQDEFQLAYLSDDSKFPERCQLNTRCCLNPLHRLEFLFK